MDAFRRGWIGLALFCAALVLMPVLVTQFDGDASEAGSSASTASVTSAPRASATEWPSPTRTPVGQIRGFLGVIEGEVHRGFLRIALETSGLIGTVTYTLSRQDGYQHIGIARDAPYVFAPHQHGWQTTAVADGDYVLEARADNPSVMPATIHFTIQNN